MTTELDRRPDFLPEPDRPNPIVRWEGGRFPEVWGEPLPKAILNIQEIAEAVGRTRLTAFVMGTNDLAKELRGVNDPPVRNPLRAKARPERGHDRKLFKTNDGRGKTTEL